MDPASFPELFFVDNKCFLPFCLQVVCIGCKKKSFTLQISSSGIASDHVDVSSFSNWQQLKANVYLMPRLLLIRRALCATGFFLFSSKCSVFL